MAQSTINEPVVMGNNAQSAESLPSIIYRDQPVLTTALLAQFYGTEPLRIRDNFRRQKDRFTEGKHYFKVVGNELKTLRETVCLTHSSPLPKTGGELSLWTARGAARHAKMLDTDKAWDVFEMLEENYFHRTADAAPVITDGPITLAQQQEIRELIDAKVSSYPDSQRRKAYGQIYKRLAVKFKVPRYQEIPASIYHDARSYLIGLDVRGVGTPALPPTEATALPAAESSPDVPISARSITVKEYADNLLGLPDSHQHWARLVTKLGMTFDQLERDMEEIKRAALRPFVANRKSQTQNRFDESMGSTFTLFDLAHSEMSTTYRIMYEALGGCMSTWRLLKHG